MWNAFDQADLFLVTTNSYVRKDGSLVMGAGAARQMRDRFRGVNFGFGRAVREDCGHLGEYGIVTIGTPLDSMDDPAGIAQPELGAFQVKTHWKNKADTQLIAGSAAILSEHLREHGPDYQVHLNFPGIGNGGLDPGDVLPIISPWPSNVHVWTYE